MGAPTNGLSNLSWKDSDVETSLVELRRYVEDQAQGQIAWYYAKKTCRARVSIALRFVAILLFVMCGLVPIINASLHQTEIDRIPFDFGQAGYLLIAVAAGCGGL